MFGQAGDLKVNICIWAIIQSPQGSGYLIQTRRNHVQYSRQIQLVSYIKSCNLECSKAWLLSFPRTFEPQKVTRHNRQGKASLPRISVRISRYTSLYNGTLHVTTGPNHLIRIQNYGRTGSSVHYTHVNRYQMSPLRAHSMFTRALRYPVTF